MEKEIEKTYSVVFAKEKYKLIIIDMDGTLYYQRKMQFMMGLEMIVSFFKNPYFIKNGKAIFIFRKIRDKSLCGEFAYSSTAGLVGRSKEEVQQVIEEWLFKRPLKHINRCKDNKLCEWIIKWKKMDKIVIVYSDYPVKDKCKVLGIEPDAMYFSDEDRIGELKPSIKGIQVICKDFQMKPEEILVIGDRYSKDGKMAEAAGCDYLILKKWEILRRARY